MRGRKTPASEYVRISCTIPNRKFKDKAISEGRLGDAVLAAARETACKIQENKLKDYNLKKSLRQRISYSNN